MTISDLIDELKAVEFEHTNAIVKIWVPNEQGFLEIESVEAGFPGCIVIWPKDKNQQDDNE